MKVQLCVFVCILVIIWGRLYLREEFLGHSYIFYIYIYMPLVIKNLPANGGDAGDASWIPQLGISPGVGNGNMLQYSCLENSRDSYPHGL